MTTRRATAADQVRLLELVDEFCAYEGYRRSAAHTLGALAPLLADDQLGQVWVVEGGGEIAGYAVLTWGWGLETGGREGLLDELYVSERNRGLGSELMDRVLTEARLARCRAVFLETEAPNEATRRFYLRHGFAAEDSIWMRTDL